MNRRANDYQRSRRSRTLRQLMAAEHAREQNQGGNKQAQPDAGANAKGKRGGGRYKESTGRNKEMTGDNTVGDNTDAENVRAARDLTFQDRRGRPDRRRREQQHLIPEGRCRRRQSRRCLKRRPGVRPWYLSANYLDHE